VFVTGCHRSGTSLLASLFRDLVCSDEHERESDLVPQIDNPPGFFESQRLVDLNDVLLSQIGASWNRPPLLPPDWDLPPLIDHLQLLRSGLSEYALNRRWVDKDPRLCITYSAYLHILLKRVPLVAIIREPLDVATSLYLRNGIPLNVGLAIWFLYNHHLAGVLEARDLLFSYGQVLAIAADSSSDHLYPQICGFLESHRHHPPSMSVWRQITSRRINPNLNRAGSALPTRCADLLDQKLLNYCQQASARIFSAGDAFSVFIDAFEAIPRCVLQALSCCAPLADVDPCPRDDLEHALECSRTAERELSERLTAIENSRSWKLFAPLRGFKDRFIHRHV
jgi:hypothetical protein